MGYANDKFFCAFRRRRREKRHLKHYIKGRLCSGFLIGKALCKVEVCSEYRVMPRIRRRNAYQQVSEFDRGRIVAYRECGLSFRDIARRTGRHPTTVMRIWNQWVAEGHTERHAGSQRPPMTNAREDRHIVRSALQNRTTTSRTISQETGMFAARPVSARTVRRRLQQRGLSSRRPLLRLPLTMQHRERRRLWCAERQSWIQEWHNVVFSDESRFCVQYSDGRIRVWRLRGDRTSPACIRYRHRGPAPGVMVWAAIGYTTRTSLVRIDGTLNADRYISDILRPVVVPYLRGLPNAIFQQDNARPHVARRVLTFLDTQGIRLLPWPARSPDLSPIENIWSWVAERLARHPSPANTVDEVWHRLEAAWNELPVSVVQAQFDSMPNRVRAVLAARGGSCFY